MKTYFLSLIALFSRCPENNWAFKKKLKILPMTEPTAFLWLPSEAVINF